MFVKRTVLMMVLLPLATSVVSASDDGIRGWFSLERKKGVQPVTNSDYLEGCGECHFAYQPGLLPAASWQRLMERSALEDHFGENAELEEADRVKVRDFLLAHSADNASYKRSKKIMASLEDGPSPLRITETRYIKRKHDKISQELIEGNAEVKALSFCNRCHTQADQGSFDDDEVVIPGYGVWED